VGISAGNVKGKKEKQWEYIESLHRKQMK